jgi:hypothetical protein
MEWVNSSKIGARWVNQTPLVNLASLTERSSGLSLSSAGFGGYDAWFCDFNDAFDFTIATPASFQTQSGPVANTEGSPKISDTAGTTGNAGTNNVNTVHRWGRNSIGGAANHSFYSNRVLASPVDMHSSVGLGSSANSTGFCAYNPFWSIQNNGLMLQREFGFIARVGRISTTQTSACFFGLEASALGTSAALTTAGALSATSSDHYCGFFIDTSNNISFACRNGTFANFSIASGKTVDAAGSTATFTTLEMRGVLVNDFSGFFTGGAYLDAYINGQLVLASSSRSHTMVPDDMIPSGGGFRGIGFEQSDPANVSMHYARTAGSGNFGMRVDCIGAWQTRAFGA